jgi:dipicolinate synthase subunit A
MQKRKYLIIGGDMRSVYLSELLKKEYHRVEMYGFEKKQPDTKNKNLSLMISDANVIICGIPLESAGGLVNMPFSAEALPVNALIEMMSSEVFFVAGKIEKEIRKQLDDRRIQYIDLLDREEMAVLNAIPAAEGAVDLIINAIPATIHNSRILVLGFGRIGKVLSKILHGFGAEVWVAARKYSDLSWIEVYGYKPVHIKDLESYVTDMDVIVNTIPSKILTADILNKIHLDCYLLDLASKPGGIDFEHAEKLGFKVDWALSIPGKIAPLTAAEVIKRTIDNVFQEGSFSK